MFPCCGRFPSTVTLQCLSSRLRSDHFFSWTERMPRVATGLFGCENLYGYVEIISKHLFVSFWRFLFQAEKWENCPCMHVCTERHWKTVEDGDCYCIYTDGGRIWSPRLLTGVSSCSVLLGNWSSCSTFSFNNWSRLVTCIPSISRIHTIILIYMHVPDVLYILYLT